MSRGFVREGDQEEPVFIPPRAPLPTGYDNLVTPRGLELLHAERVELERQRAEVDLPDGPARRRELAEINGRLALLAERIASARVVEPRQGSDGEVRFGSTVTFVISAGPQQGARRTFTLVGVDEAKVAEGRIAFTAPVAQALMGKKAGQLAEFRLGTQVQALLVKAVT
ncbi:MAG: GreA/GreB family elongation factor [Flavobacteriales bacterium]|nr:GreA/GreB family elongation factor [Flavobacteriales bacterium]MEB2341637.1 GreA/GreB family elongation factor [Flavobacteriia bacterium]